MCFKDGEDPKDSIDKAFAGKDKKPSNDKSTPKDKITLSKSDVLDKMENDVDPKREEAVNGASKMRSDLRTESKTMKIPDEDMQKFVEKQYGVSKHDYERNKIDSPDAIEKYREAYILQSETGDISKKYYTNTDRLDQQKKFDTLLKNNPDSEFAKSYKIAEDRAVDFNKSHKEVYDSTPSFFRGTSDRELDSYMDNSKIGGDDNNYKYVAMSTDPTSAHGFAAGVVVEYDADSVRPNSKMVEYTASPIVLGQSKSVNTSEAMGKPMNIQYSDEKELRVREGLSILPGSSGVKIKNIYIDEGNVATKYNIDLIAKTTGAKIIHYDGTREDFLRKLDWKMVNKN